MLSFPQQLHSHQIDKLIIHQITLFVYTNYFVYINLIVPELDLFRFDSMSPMALVLVGQSELWDEKLRLKRYAAVRQRIDINCVLPHLDRPETEKYVKSHLAYAGVTGQELFSRRALDEIYRLSSGIPRLIVYSDRIEHSARRFRADLPPFQSNLSALLSTPFRKSSAYLSGYECNDRFSIPPESLFRAL